MAYQYARSGVPKYDVIELGARVCENIKRVLYPETPWAECYKDVAAKFSKLKEINKSMRNVHKTDIEYIKFVGKFDDFNLREMLDK